MSEATKDEEAREGGRGRTEGVERGGLVCAFALDAEDAQVWLLVCVGHDGRGGAEEEDES